ncbi:MAG TPA: FAD:protein FMN transferase [Acidimicrobiales bacterium]|nr:FAD:protein FMN transferase [Acidimicrobiales bacterium]
MLVEGAHAEAVMGTVVSISWWSDADHAGACREAVATACRRLHDTDRRFSTWIPDSPMNRVRRGELKPADDPLIAGVLDRCAELREVSAGWFDPWAGPGGVDPTGMVKGWAAELACGDIAEGGASAALVNAGGDIATHGAPPADPGATGPPGWRVGIRHPWRPDALAGVVFLPPGGTVATSGVYERGPHLWEPGTGAPAPAAASATVCGPSLTVADALATALAVGRDEVLTVLEAGGEYEGWLIGPDGSETGTPGFPWVPPVPTEP